MAGWPSWTPGKPSPPVDGWSALGGAPHGASGPDAGPVAVPRSEDAAGPATGASACGVGGCWAPVGYSPLPETPAAPVPDAAKPGAAVPEAGTPDAGVPDIPDADAPDADGTDGPAADGVGAEDAGAGGADAGMPGKPPVPVTGSCPGCCAATWAVPAISAGSGI
ncbi:hypothetical protein ACFPCY_38535 [Actinomadura gamaensis]|uniref:Skin secretory protein xP2-like n=1 Tax=Actinomadura gamaensis TaxID=1763541 RepID=A0ABV9U9K4_9ACTN